MQQLAALVPRPRLNLIRFASFRFAKYLLTPFHGVLAPNAKLRSEIIPGSKKNKSNASNVSDAVPPSSASVRISWARLLKCVFEIDIERCPHCGGNMKIIAAILERAANPSALWAYDGSGYLLLQSGGLQVLVTTQPAGASPLHMQAFDPSGQAPQYWFLNNAQPAALQQPAAAPGARTMHTLSVGDAPLGAQVASLKVKMTISNDWFSGTAEAIYVTLSSSQNNWTQIMNGVNRGESAEVTIDLAATFPGEQVTFQSLSNLYIGFGLNSPGVITDEVKVAAIILTATDSAGKVYQNNSFAQLNQWIRPQFRTIFHWARPVSWTGNISWDGWRNAGNLPVDLCLKTYSVTLQPYVGDLLSWRSYNPSTIDGVGLLIGSMNGQIAGERLKTQQCEILGPGAYTWVYVPDGDAIIYKYWEKTAPLSNYTRHSQLGSGNPVVCAGELQISQSLSSGGMQAMIVMVNDASGHYKPDGGACLKYVSDKLGRLGIATSATQWYWS